MLINFQLACRKHRLKPRGVIMVGSNTAQEHEEFTKMGLKEFIYIEPCTKAFSTLNEKLGGFENVKLFNTACGNYTGQVMMHIEESNGGQSNSIRTPAKHLTAHPDINFIGTEVVDITRLDDLEFDRSLYNFLSVDVQGYEDEVLKGAKETMKHIDIVLIEVNRDELYEGCPRVQDILNLLPGFRKIELLMTQWNWGDMLLKRV